MDPNQLSIFCRGEFIVSTFKVSWWWLWSLLVFKFSFGKSFPNVIYQLPSLAFCETCLPRNHGRAALRDFPKQLAIFFTCGFDALAEVCWFLFQRRCARSIAFAFRTMARETIGDVKLLP